jgi:putative hydrolase
MPKYPMGNREPEKLLTNSQIAELLALEAERAEGHRRQALHRAAHAAFMWPQEASQMLQSGESLTQLPGVGPFLARTIATWVENPPELTPPPEHRRHFLTLTQAKTILQDHHQFSSKLKGDLQMHTTWSDGSGTVQQMAEAAIARNYHYISITDHTKGLKIAGGIDETELLKQWTEIDQINAEFQSQKPRFRILKSVELNLSPTGEGDMDPQILSHLDIVLGSFHSQLRKTDDQTDRYLSALNNPDIQILGHPRGRVYNYRVGLKADWARVFAHAAKLDKAVEIDSFSDRQDLDLELLQIARQEGVRISLSTDAHHPWQLNFMHLGLAAALLAGIKPDRIINFMTAEELMAWVANTRAAQFNAASFSSRPVQQKASATKRRRSVPNQ